MQIPVAQLYGLLTQIIWDQGMVLDIEFYGNK